MFAKITYLEGPKQLPKYFFELVGLKHELTPDESSIKRVLKGLEASEDSKISCLEPIKGWLFVTDLDSEKVVSLMNRDIEFRIQFENGKELNYPFFIYYDKYQNKVYASNFESTIEPEESENPSPDKA